MMLRKRVPVIVPLHEIVKPESSPSRETEVQSGTAKNENGSTTGSLVPSPVVPVRNLKPPPPKPAVREDTGKPPMRPLRKNKRLRPAVLSHSAADSAEKSVSRQKVVKIEPDERHGGRNSKGSGSDVIEVEEVSVNPSGKAQARAQTQASKRNAAGQRRSERETNTSFGSDSRGSTVCSPASSVLGSNDDVSTEALMKIAGVAQQERIVWTKIKGHPYWPAQCVRMSPEIEADERFKKAAKFKRKVDDTCVMYFGTCEIAYVNREKACISWDEGLKKNMHLSHKGRNMFQRALTEVKAYCHRQTRYPRGWWCEPPCMILASEFFGMCMSENLQAKVKPFIKVAELELIFWAKIRGFPQWPVQALPRNMACERYPELKLNPENNVSNTSVPCMFFGTGEVALVADKNRTPFGAGLARGYGTASDRRDFVVATGEMWGYLQTPRVWPSGYLSGQLWWNYEETTEVEKKPVDDVMEVRVAHMPEYEHIKRSVWAEGIEVPPRAKKTEIACCACTARGTETYCVDSRCLNFASRFLCNPGTCPAGKQCANLPFYLRNIPRVKPFFTADQRGWGLRAEEPIKNGSFVIEYIGEIINRLILDRRLKKTQRQKSSEYYMMDLTNDLLVDAKFKGNLSRFINSSCEPNCATQKWIDAATGQTHVGIFAIQDIEAGTELTYNYCFEDYGLTGKSQKRSFMCQCGTSSCCMLEPVEQSLMKKLVGKRLEVRWDDGWYPGVVELYDLKKKRFRVQYDDGDCEDLVLGLPLENDDGVAFRLVSDKTDS